MATGQDSTLIHGKRSYRSVLGDWTLLDESESEYYMLNIEREYMKCERARSSGLLEDRSRKSTTR